MPITDRTRAIRMGQRLCRTVESKGGSSSLSFWLHYAHTVATQPRDAALDDDHDPRYLHPGRSALILMLDLELLDPVALGIALWHDSEDPDLAPEPEDLELDEMVMMPTPDLSIRATIESVLELRASLPCHGDEELAAKLVVLDHELACAALAERLDHLRHLHLQPVDPAAREVWREARDVWSPMAERTHPDLARRYEWWTRKFAGRYS